MKINRINVSFKCEDKEELQQTYDRIASKLFSSFPLLCSFVGRVTEDEIEFRDDDDNVLAYCRKTEIVKEVSLYVNYRIINGGLNISDERSFI